MNVLLCVIPIVLAAPGSEAGQPAGRPLVLRGTHYLVYTVAAGEQVRFSLKASGDGSRGGPVTCEAIDQDSATLVPRRSIGQSGLIECRAARAGLGALIVDAERYRVAIDTHGRQVMFCARPSQPFHVIGPAGPVYFYLPRSQATVEVFIATPDRREGATIRVLDPHGKVAAHETGQFPKPVRLRCRAAKEDRGKVWSLVLDNPKREGKPYAVDDVLIHFGPGLPPFVATSPQALLAVLTASGELRE